ncbi:MAG: hypothetical protein A2046_05135 [Bacteroidetes bacterium GWA2_30_7]|nr:MAG: hypothetical protein A2046_05135 [Bacteroidetes bacterium GWA2_30_7]
MSYSQTNRFSFDSAKIELLKSKNVENSLQILNEIALQYNESNLDSALHYSYLAQSIAKRISNRSLFADTYYSLGVIFKNKGVVDSANYYLFNSLKIYENLKDIDNVIKLNISIGEYYRSTYNLNKAVQYLKKSITLSQNYNLYGFLPSAYNRLGAVYFELSINNSALDAIYEDTIYKSISYIDSSNYWSSRINTKSYNISNNNILGACYQNLKNYDKANLFLLKALNEAENEKKIIELPMIYRNISLNYMKLKNYKKAEAMALEGAKIADSLGINTSLMFNYYALVLIGENLNDDKMTLNFLRKKDSVEDILNNEKAIIKTKEFEAKFKTKEKELLIERQNSELEKNHQQFILSLIGFLVSFLVVIAILFFTLRIRRINKLLKIKNKEVEFASNEVSKLSRFKDDLTGMIVHDLKNPLNIIINFSKNVIQSENTNLLVIKEKNKNIENAAFNMLNIVNNIIDLQKLEESKIDLVFSENRILKTINRALQNVNLLLTQKNITVNNKVNSGFISVYDNNLIERVLINLLTNAIKFSPNNDTITIDAEIINNFIKVRVSDSGQGIPSDKIPHLFNKFARAEIKNIGFSTSSGLGLAFSKLVIKEHGGEIGVDSECKKGSCFWFTLKSFSVNLIEEIKEKSNENISHEYSKEFSQNIIALKKILAEYKFYETSEILNTLQNFKCTDNEFFDWKNKIENAVMNSNNEKYLELISL